MGVESILGAGGVLVFGLIGIASLVLFIWALIDILQTQFKDSTMKIVWVLIVLIVQFIGPLIWLLWGRKNA